jgi:hypothetical protein
MEVSYGRWIISLIKLSFILGKVGWRSLLIENLNKGFIYQSINHV